MPTSSKTPDSTAAPGAGTPPAQQRLISALLQPSRYPHPVETIERVETHISTLLLAGDYAYKIKKAVELDFVDYSTLEQRRFYCEEEVRLNRRFAPDLYLGCVAIRGSADDPTWDSHGRVIEYAVKMRRFPQTAQADWLAQRGSLGASDMDALASKIAQFHESAPRQGWERVYGLPKTVEQEAVDNVTQLQPMLGDDATRRQADELAAWTRREARERHPEFSQRVETGCVRECHGDLHLANLILRARRWSAFDCVEFDAHLRWIDVMNDIAFTLMDLHAYRLAPLAHRLLNRYLEITGDYAGLAVLRFYFVYRALVRAKVLALSARSAASPEARDHYMSRHRRYLDTATALARGAGPRLVITHGVSGSGKSWAASWAAEHYGYIRIRSDVERKRLHDLAPEARTGSPTGSGIYSWADTRNTYRRMMELAEYALAGGWRVILDAAFLNRDHRDEARALARRLGCPFAILSLTTPAGLARARLRARGGTDVSEATEEVLDAQLADYQPLSTDERDVARCTTSDKDALEPLFSGWEAD